MGGINVTKLHRNELQQKIDSITGFINEMTASPEQQRVLADAYSLKKELRGKRYGLRFEEHREQIDNVLEHNVPVLTECDDLRISSGGEQNFLIEGDNLAALDLLCRTHAGKIAACYIDPPYNLQGDFRYDDDYVDKNDLFRHSKWLSFMDRRLRLAKKLLSTEGAIFISINDVEQAPLKMLCDDIFGPDCFQGCICWQKTYSPRNDKHGLSAECEYILVYSKLPDWLPRKLNRSAEMDSRYSSPDGDPRPWKNSDASAPGAGTHHGMVYAVQHPISFELIYPTSGRHWSLGQDKMLEIMNGWADYELVDIHDDARRAQICGCSAADVQPGVKALMLSRPTEITRQNATVRFERGNWPILYVSGNGQGGLRRKTYLDEVGGKIPTNLWMFSEVGHTDEAKKELKKVFGGEAPFDTPKPTRLIERIIDISTADGDTVLDFFAGSASTAHAVLQHNAEHDGHRKFIVVTNNENGICREVAYERIRRAIEGYPFKGKQSRIVFEEKIQAKHFKKEDAIQKLFKAANEACDAAMLKHDKASIKVEDGFVRVIAEDACDSTTKPLPGSLKYMRVDFIPYSHEDSFEAADAVMERIKEMVELENGIDFDSDPRVAIALDDDELDELVASLDERCESVYVGNDVLLSAHALRVFREKLISVNIIPDYYYRELEA